MGNAKRRQLNAQVWDIAHSIVEAVGEIGGAQITRVNSTICPSS